MGCEEIGEADDEHNRSVFYVDDEVIANLRHDISQSLRQDNVRHGLYMGHTDCLCTFGLAGVDGNDAAADGFSHVCTGVDGYNKQSCYPNVSELQSVIGEVRETVVHENCLQNHGGATKYFHVKTYNYADEFQDDALGQGIVFRIGDSV